MIAEQTLTGWEALVVIAAFAFFAFALFLLARR